MDRLPNGNVLTSFWPGILQPNSTEGAIDAEFYVTEIDRDADAVVWELKVHGRTSSACDASGGADACGRSLWGGWRAYSVERAFAGPLVLDASCVVEAGAAALRFSAANAIKQQNAWPATFAVVEKAEGSPRSWKGDFEFAPHWRATAVAFDLGSDVAGGATLSLTVTNAWGADLTLDVACVDAEIPS